MAKSRKDRTPETLHAKILFNSAHTCWYNVTDKTPSGSYDFISVALHELAHALFFNGAIFIGETPESLMFASQNNLPSRFNQFIQLNNSVGLVVPCKKLKISMHSQPVDWGSVPQIHHPLYSTCMRRRNSSMVHQFITLKRRIWSTSVSIRYFDGRLLGLNDFLLEPWLYTT